MKLTKKVQRLIEGEFPLRLEFGQGKDRIKSYNDNVQKLAERIIRIIEDEWNRRRK